MSNEFPRNSKHFIAGTVIILCLWLLFYICFGLLYASLHMPTLKNLKVTIYSRNNRELPPTEGTVSCASWSQPERTKNALKIFGILITGCFCSLLIHLGSIILVPSFFFASFYFGFDKYNELQTNEGGAGECTKCHQPLVIVKSKMKERLTDTCAKCFEELELFVEKV